MTAMNDDDVSRLLKDLPRHQASAEFTDRVLARLDHSPTVAPRRSRWLVATSAAAVLLGVWFTHGAIRERAERQRAAARLESLREEYRALERELEQLRALTAEAEPVIDLGGTEQVDFVFDLRRLADERGGARARPTSHAPR